MYFCVQIIDLFNFKGSFLFSFQPTGENGATRAPISIDLQRDDSLSSKSIILQIDNKSQQVSASQSLQFVFSL